MTREKRSIAELAREYIEARPSVRDCLAAGIVNYTLLARRIMEEIGISNEEAVTVACRRYRLDLGRAEEHQRSIRALLAESTLEVKDGVGVIVMEAEHSVVESVREILPRLMGRRDLLQVVMSGNALTIITGEKDLDGVISLVNRERVLKVNRDLAQISVRSPERIEDVHGVLAYLSGTLAEFGINIVEAYSCHRDTVFIVSEPEVMRAYTLLRKVIKRVKATRR